MSESISCISCNEDKTHTICTKNGYQVVECDACGLQYVDPPPVPEDIYELYRHGTLIEDSETEQFDNNGFIVRPSWKVREFAGILGDLNKLVTPGRILEVGSLWGIFLEMARDAGWEPFGVEPWSKAAAYCRNRMDLNVFAGTLNEINFRPLFFDAVVMLDVLEHCPEPRDELAKIHSLLKLGGILCILTPNARGLLPRASAQRHKLAREPWTSLIPPFHLYAFAISTLKQLLLNEGFEIICFNHLGIDSRISPSKTSPKMICSKALSFIGKKLRLGDRIVMYATKQESRL